MSKALLLDVLKSPQDFGLKKEAIIGRRLDYIPPVGREVFLLKGMTGSKKDQEFMVERDMPFYLFLFQGRAVGISGRRTANKLTLGKKIGYDNSLECIKSINALYVSEELGTEVAELTRKMYESMPKILKKMCYRYWISDQYRTPSEFDEDCYLGLFAVYSTVENYYWLYNGTSRPVTDHTRSLAVRIPIYIKSDICIDTDQLCDMDEPIKLILPEKPQEIVLPEIELPNQGGTVEQLLAENQQLKAEIARMKKELDKEQDVINAVRQILRRY